MTKTKLIRELWRLVKVHDPKNRYCKNACSLRGELRALLKKESRELAGNR